MEPLLNQTFLNSIVCLEDFKLNYKCLDLTVLCIEGADTEVHYQIQLYGIIYFFFSQADFESEFSVIDTFLERFNDCEEVRSRHSAAMEDFWVLRFHSGIHHVIAGFKDLKLTKVGSLEGEIKA